MVYNINTGNCGIKADIISADGHTYHVIKKLRSTGKAVEIHGGTTFRDGPNHGSKFPAMAEAQCVAQLVHESSSLIFNSRVAWGLERYHEILARKVRFTRIAQCIKGLCENTISIDQRFRRQDSRCVRACPLSW